MKDIKTFIIVDLIILVLKLVGGFITHSFTMMVSGVFDLVLILCAFVAFKGHSDNKKLSIATIIIGVLSILSAGGMIVWAFLTDINKTSLWVILFLVLALIMRYIVSCFYTNVGYQRKRGLLSYSNIRSNLDFYTYGIILLALVLMKVSKWATWLKYADRVGAILLAVLLIIKGIKLIKNSIAKLKGKEKVIEEKVINDIKERAEVKNLARVEIQYYGGVKVAKCDIVLKDGIGMVDVNSFVVTLQDYLLKFADAARIYMPDKESHVLKKAKVRSLKQDARNSGSRNSKTSPKKKNNKKTNKKR